MSLTAVQHRIDAALTGAGRAPDAARLIVVSKTHPADRIADVLRQGHHDFGENRVQEAAEKWPALCAAHPGTVLHLIGPLQTNKARAAMELAQVIHTLDRPKLATTIARLAQEIGRCPDLFVQVNTGDEPQKAGVANGDVDAFVADCRALDLPVVGLMCIPPVDADPAPHFAMLADMAARNGLQGLSMGMSADFERAIALGATHVRVGSAIFGERAVG